MKTVVKVPVIESESGWGSKIDDHMICLTVDVAKEFITEFNSKNDSCATPTWYMYANDDIKPIDITDDEYRLLEVQEKHRIWLSILKSIKDLDKLIKYNCLIMKNARGIYTGEVDKEGNEINYETSILELPDGTIGVLMFDYDQLSAYFAKLNGAVIPGLTGVNNSRSYYLRDCLVVKEMEI